MLGIVAALAFLYSREPDSGHVFPPAERRQISELALPRLDGTPWRLSEQKGSVVLLNFWATWCAPCVHEIPALADLSGRYRQAGLVVAGIAMDEEGAPRVEPFVRQHRIPYPVLMPSTSGRLSLSSTLQGLPTSVLLDRQLRVAKTYIGAFSKSVFERDIARLLDERHEGTRSVPVLDARPERIPPRGIMMNVRF